MPYCSTQGRRKASVVSYLAAVREAKRMTKKHGIWFRPYKCPECKRFHIGRKYQTIELSQFMLERRRDEVRVGKLVHALRLVLDKERT